MYAGPSKDNNSVWPKKAFQENQTRALKYEAADI